MDLFEYETSERMSREDAAKRLRELADQLERHNEVSVKRDGLPFTIKVPSEVTFTLEVEIEDDESEIEVSVSW